MIELLKPYVIAKDDEDLDFEERNILSVAYKNAVGLRRIAWRAVKKASTMYKDPAYSEQIKQYLRRLEDECVEICKDMLSLITKHLLPRAKEFSEDIENQVYYLKLQADYFRYVAEVGSSTDRVDKAKTRALSSYQKAMDLASELSHADPIRLSLLLNLSVYKFEMSSSEDGAAAIKAAREEAINMAKTGIQKAEDELELLDN